MKIVTERLALVAIDADSAHSFAEYIREKKHIQSHLERLEADAKLLGWGVWLVLNSNTGEAVGDIGFKGKPVEGTVEVGYGFLPEARNQGYATESVSALLEWAFSTNQVNRILAECLADNQASIRVLEKLGMQRTEEKSEMIYWTLLKSNWTR